MIKSTICQKCLYILSCRDQGLYERQRICKRGAIWDFHWCTWNTTRTFYWKIKSFEQGLIRLSLWFSLYYNILNKLSSKMVSFCRNQNFLVGWSFTIESLDWSLCSKKFQNKVWSVPNTASEASYSRETKFIRPYY